MRKKLGLDVRDYSIAKTGILTVLDELVKGFQNDEEFELILLRPRYVIQGENALIKVLGHIDFVLWKQIRLPILAKIRRCDYLLSNDYVSPYYSFGIEAIPIFHGLNFWEQPQNYNRAWRKLFTWMAEVGAHQAKKVLTVSSFTKDKLCDILKVDPDKIFVLPLGAKTRISDLDQKDDTEILGKFELKSNNYLLHVGVLEKRKNLVRLIRAFSNLNDPGFKLVLAGPKGPKKDMDASEEIIREVQQSNRKKNVVMTGFLSDDELQTLYRNAQLCVLPSTYEGFGIPALEAFEYRVPLVSSRSGALPEVVGDDGLYFEANDENDMRQKISIAMDDQLVRQSLVSNGVERLKLYNWTKCILTLKKILEND